MWSLPVPLASNSRLAERRKLASHATVTEATRELFLIRKRKAHGFEAVRGKGPAVVRSAAQRKHSFYLRSSFDLPKLSTFQFDESNGIELVLERSETLTLPGTPEVYVLYLALLDSKQAASGKRFQGWNKRQDHNFDKDLISTESRRATGRADEFSAPATERLLPLFLEDKLERDMIVLSIVHTEPPAAFAEREPRSRMSAGSFSIQMRLKLLQYLWRSRDVFTEVKSIYKLMQARESSEIRESNLLFSALLNAIRSKRLQGAHALFLDLIRQRLQSDILQVVLAPVSRRNPEQLRAYVCLELRSSQRQPWFVRMRGSDGAVFAFLAGCPLKIDRDVWEYASISTRSIPLGDSVVFPMNRNAPAR
jgi:hypothetical protein